MIPRLAVILAQFNEDAGSCTNTAPPRTADRNDQPVTQSLWRPIETLPEGQLALLWAEYADPQYVVDSFTWRVERQDELVQETATRKVYEKREIREREWKHEGWSSTHWMPLPESPVETR